MTVIKQVGGITMEYMGSPDRVISHYHLDLNGMCVKWILFSLNFVMSLAGQVMLGLGVYLSTSASSYETWFGGETVSVSYLLIITGTGICIAGLMGCCGANIQSTPLLLTYFVLVLVLVLVQCAGLITAYVFSEELELQIGRSAKSKIALYGEPNSKTLATEPIDVVQKQLQCCGLTNGPIDWSNGKRYKAATYWIKTHSKDVPESCCVTKATNCGTGLAVKEPDSQKVFTKGCENALKDFMSTNLQIVGVAGCVVLVHELLGLCGSFYLRRWLNKSYK